MENLLGLMARKRSLGVCIQDGILRFDDPLLWLIPPLSGGTESPLAVLPPLPTLLNLVQDNAREGHKERGMEIKGYFVSDIPRRAFLERTLKGGLVLAAGPSLVSLLEGCAGQEMATAKVQIDPRLLDGTIRAALTRGGDFADVYVENRIARSVVMEESRFKSAEFGVSQGAGVRVIAGEKTGYAYTEEITEEALRRAAEVASYIARGATTCEPVAIGESTPHQVFNTVQLPLEDIADARRLEIMERANQAALDYDPRIAMASINYNDEVRGRVIACT